MRVTLGGAEVDLLHREEVIDRFLHAIQSGSGCRPLFVTGATLEHVYNFGIDSGREGAFDAGRGGADWLVLPSRFPIGWAARRLTGVAWEHVGGPDLLPDLLRTAGRTRARVGFLGGNRQQADSLAAILATHFPNVDVAGHWIPDRAVIDDHAASQSLTREMTRTGLDVLVVGLGKLRQEEWLLRHGSDTGAKVVLAHGSAEFLVSWVGRVPDQLRTAGQSFATRAAQAPRQLLNRPLVHIPSAVIRLMTQSRSDGSDSTRANTRPTPVLATPMLWRRRIGKALALVDAATIAASSALAYLLRDALGEAGVVQGFANEVPAALSVIPIWLLIFYFAGAYRPEILNTGGDAFRRFVAGASGGLLAIGFLSFLLNLSLSRLYVFMLFAFVLVLGGLGRVGLRRYLRSRRARGRLRQNVLIAGADADAVEVATALAADKMGGYTPVGFLTSEWEIGKEPLVGVPVVGCPDDVLDAAYDHRAGLVIVSPTGVSPGTLQDLTLALEGTPIDLAVAPSLFQVVSRRVTVESVASVPLLHVDQIRLERGRAALKRLEDLVVAGSLFVLTLPVVLLAMVAIRLDTPGPVMFVQRRVGRDGRRINVLKLRTMVVGAEEQQEELADRNEAEGHFFKMLDDPRVTRVGRFLRKWSIDELPQLHNVLRGDMSMVGPRPPTPGEVEKYEPWHMRRLRVRPGITGAWQTAGRSEIGFDEAVKLDLFYIENWSIGYDLFLLGKTVLAVLSRRGAY